ncbi:hypothetical protein [Nitrosomonas sp.]|uniref:hypothetical protein n=1 Tax=Nitrosomonas sp. TaxID=42353 RepID=UPI0025D04EC9|nr:hypothetical protein [Nitrosomonas sp.]MBV6447075.1 hypothetical protein [Nitrosomonas sp.]
MMAMNQITDTLRCTRMTATNMLEKAGVQKVVVPFKHGKKHFWRVTHDRLLEIKANQQKDPQKIAVQQAAALSLIESVFLHR